MPDWVEVYKRLLQIYNVRTQAQLSMAMGVPGVIAGRDVEQVGISWKVLAKAVAQKDLSWDWLLDGKGEAPRPQTDSGESEKRDPGEHGGAGDGNPTGGEESRRSPPPIPMETWELKRQLLGADPCRPCHAKNERRALENVERALEEFRTSLQSANGGGEDSSEGKNG